MKRRPHDLPILIKSKFHETIMLYMLLLCVPFQLFNQMTE